MRVKQNKTDGWINQQIIGLILKRDKLKRRLFNDNKKGLNTDELHEQYKYFRNLTNYSIRKRKKNFYVRKLSLVVMTAKSYGKRYRLLFQRRKV